MSKKLSPEDEWHEAAVAEYRSHKARMREVKLSEELREEQYTMPGALGEASFADWADRAAALEAEVAYWKGASKILSEELSAQRDERDALRANLKEYEAKYGPYNVSLDGDDTFYNATKRLGWGDNET